MTPITLATIYHTGAYSACKAFRDAGYTVVPKGGIGIEGKLAAIHDNRAADVIWVHWTWIDRCPSWVLDREVVVLMRDPIESLISASVRGQYDKRIAQAQQWLYLWQHRHQVDHWIEFPRLDFSRWGLLKLPHENATAEAHALKVAYRSYKAPKVARSVRKTYRKQVRNALAAQWDCLMVVRREINELFRLANMAHLIARSCIRE